MSQWPMVKLGELISKASVKKAGDSNLPILSMTMHEGLVLQSSRFGKRIASNSTAGYQIVNKNQLVVGFPIDEGVLDIQTLADEAMVSPAYKIWNIKDTDEILPEFLRLYLRSDRALAFYSLKLRGTTARRRSLPDDIFLSMPVMLPPLEEQRRIAKILQHSTFSIDSSWREIELLHNLRNSQFVPSNTSEKVHLDELVTVQSEQVDPTLPDHQNQLHVAPDSIKSNNSTFNEIRTCAEDAVISGKYKFSAGDILYSKIRPYLNKVAIPSFDGVCSADMYVIKPKSGISAEYVRAILMSPHFLAYAEKESGRASIPKINRKALLSYKLPKPSEEDISVTTTRIREIDNAIAKMTKRMRLVEELHRSLATRAFAGQL